MISAILAGLQAALGLGSAAYGYHKDKQQQQAEARGENIDLVRTATPQQSQLIGSMGKLGGPAAQGTYGNVMGNPYAGLQNILQQRMMDYQQQAVPDLAEQFTSMGEGAQRSSGFPLALGQQEAQFQTGLAGDQMQFGQQRLGQQQQLLSMLMGPGLQKPFEPVYKQQGASPWASMLGQLGAAAPYFMRS